jgi:hypothetical protein
VKRFVEVIVGLMSRMDFGMISDYDFAETLAKIIPAKIIAFGFRIRPKLR